MSDLKNSEELTLEEALSQLDGIVNSLEDASLPLEQAFAKYQQGMELLKLCNDRIDKVEQKVMVLNGEGGQDEFQ